MRNIKPPILKDILERHFADIAVLLAKIKITDSKGRYLPWVEFKYRYEQPLLAWAASKQIRSSMAIELPLSDKDGKAFTYTLLDAFLPYLHTIDRLAKPLLSSNDNQDNKQFLIQALTEEAINSAQLEGASTTRKVAKEMLDNERAPRNEHERMIVNNYALMRYAQEHSEDKLSIELIKTLHGIAVNETENPYIVAGAFRSDNDVFVADADGNKVHQPPCYQDIPLRLAALCDFVNTDHNNTNHFIHPVIKAIIIHFMLGYEHPFVDGNGRTARALFYWFMFKQGYRALEYISISQLLKQAPKQYGLSYLYTETDDNDMVYFIDYQLRIINRAIETFSQYLQRKHQQHADMMQRLQTTIIGKNLNVRQIDIIGKCLKQSGRIFTVKEIMHDYQISENSARADLQKLVEYRILTQAQAYGRTRIYIALSDIAHKLNLSENERLNPSLKK